jgi:two-component system, NtrC family, response regulator HupR/HoxA
MSVGEVSWQDLMELHVVRRLKQIIARRFGTELSIATADGKPLAGMGECARQAAAAVSTARGASYACAAHGGRRELAAPVIVDGAPFGCLYGAAPRSEKDEEFLAELLELCADEMASFAQETFKDRRQAGKPDTPGKVYEGIVGESAPMRDLYRMLDKVVQSESTVLVTGENGTGKELIARAIHYNSPRARERFVVQNCSAFNDNLLDSELFGHKKGAFTGAIADKQGLFEVADGGTFFLDEIGDMSPALQVKVLRVLQEGTFTPVGDTQVRTVDVRIIAATNRDLRKMVEDGSFREDLYYRVNVITLHVPALRDRRDDIPVLIDYFLRRNAKGRRLKVKRLSQGCSERMLEYGWPGNIRELENEIERLVVLAGDEKVIAEGLLSGRIKHAARDDGAPPSGPASLPAAVDTLERNLIYEVLKKNHWNKTRAAAELRISRRNLIRKVAKYQLEQRRAR